MISLITNIFLNSFFLIFIFPFIFLILIVLLCLIIFLPVLHFSRLHQNISTPIIFMMISLSYSSCSYKYFSNFFNFRLFLIFCLGCWLSSGFFLSFALFCCYFFDCFIFYPSLLSSESSALEFSPLSSASIIDAGFLDSCFFS